MFDTLADRFDGIFTKLRSRGKLTDKEIDEVCRELRVALLEADVNVVVARNFIRRVKERAQGAEVAKSLSPAQQVIKIVNEELIEPLGGTTEGLDQLLVDDLDDLLRGREALRHFGALGTLLHPADEVAGDDHVDVGLEQRDAQLTTDLVDLLVGQLPPAAELGEDAVESIGQRVEH